MEEAILLVLVASIWHSVHGLASTTISNAAFSQTAYYVLHGDTTDLSMSATNGENAIYELILGDNFVTMTCSGGSSTVVLSHDYLVPGIYNVTLLVYNDATENIAYTTVNIGEPIVDLHVITNGTVAVDSFIWPMSYVEFTLKKEGLVVETPVWPKVTCDFYINTTAKDIVSEYLGDVVDSATLNHVFVFGFDTPAPFSPTGPLAIHVHCHNPFGAVTEFNFTKNVTIYNTANTLAFGPTQLSEAKIGQPFTLDITFLDGELGADFLIDYGDGSTPLSVHKMANFTDSSYMYLTVGNYTLTVTMDDGVTSEVITFPSDIVSQHEVVGLVLDLPVAAGRGYVLGPVQLVAPLAFTVELSAGFDPAELVTCELLRDNVTVDGSYVGDLATGPITTYSYTDVYDAAVPTRQIDLRCFNLVSEQVVPFPLGVYHQVDNISLTLDPPADYTTNGELANFLLSFDGGEPGVEVTFFTGEDEVYMVCHPDGSDVVIQHTYSAMGVYTASVTLKDVAHSLTTDITIEVINIVSDLLYAVIDDVLVWPNSILELTIDLDTPAQTNPPSYMNCTIDFDDGGVVAEEIHGTVSSLWNHVHTSRMIIYDGANLTRNVFVNCFNWISSQNATFPVLVGRHVENIKIQTELGFTHTSTADPTVFNITSLYGESGVRYTVYWGDDFMDMSCQSPNAFFQITHTYETSGIYNVSMIAKDKAGYEYDFIYPFLVQNKFTEVLLDSNPVYNIYDPGPEVNLSLYVDPAAISAINLPPEAITCDIDFGDGTVETHIVGDMDPANTYEYRHMYTYVPGDPERNVTMNCSNVVSDHTFEIPLLVTKAIYNVVVESNTYFTPVFEDVNITVTALGGEAGATSIINYGDGIIETNCYTFWPNISTTHAYQTDGFFNLSAAAKDGKGSPGDYAPELIYAQHKVQFLEVAPPDYVVVPKTDVLFDLTLNAAAVYTPNNVSCTFTSLDGAEGTILYGDLALGWSGSFIHAHPDPVVYGTVQESMINCSNQVSYQLLPINVTVFLPITNLQLTAEHEYVNSYDNANLMVTAQSGEAPTKYFIDLDDSFVHSFCHSDNHWDFNHTYNWPDDGVYNVLLVADDKGVTLDDTATLYIQHPLTTISAVTLNTPWTIPDGIVDFDVTSAATGRLPTNVSCVFDHPDGTVTAGYEVGPNWLAPYRHTWTFAVGTPTGYVTTTVTCSNEISSATTNVTYYLLEQIQGLTVTPDSLFGPAPFDTYIAPLYSPVEFTMDRTFGTNVTYRLDFDDGTPQESFYCGEGQNYTVRFTHHYTVQGFYNISLTAYNFVESVDASVTALLEIQRTIEDFEMYSDAPKPLPPGTLTLYVRELDLAVPPPQGMYIIFDYQDGVTGEDLAVDVDTIIGHVHIYNFTEFSIGNSTAEAHLYNRVSDLYQYTNITVVDLIVDIASEPALPPEWIAETDAVINFQSTAVRGSHMDWSIAYGDALSDSICHYFGTDLTGTAGCTETVILNRAQDFPHAYTLPGNYSVTVDASNMYNSDSYTYPQDVWIQNRVPLITVASNTPVLTPPGLIDYVLSQRDAAIRAGSDVTCVWSYGDGTIEDRHYFPTMGLPDPWSYHYAPSELTIVPVLTTTVNCSNYINSEVNSTDVEIIANIMDIGPMENDGPAQPNEDMTWTFEVINFAEDPCFIWTLYMVTPNQKSETLMKTILTGRLECQTLHPGYDEFELITGVVYWLNYSQSFANVSLYNMKVRAVNSISEESTENLGMVVHEFCDKPWVFLGEEAQELSSPRKVYFSDAFTLFAQLKTKCHRTHGKDYDLIVENLVDDVTSVPFPIEKPKSLNFNFKAQTFPVGLYNFTLYGYMINIVGFKGYKESNKTSRYILVRPSPLSPFIVGGATRQHKQNQELFLDGSTSFDPDTTSSDGLSYKWACHIPTASPLPLIDWDNITEYDVEDCFASESDVTYQSENITISSFALIDEHYTFTLLIEKDNRSAEFVQHIKLIPSIALQLNIECVRNCQRLVNNGRTLHLRGTCVDCAFGEEVVYQWKVQTNGTVVQVPHEYVIDGNVIDIKVLNNILTEGLTYNFILNGETTDGQRLGETNLEVTVNTKPHSGKCIVKVDVTNLLAQENTIDCLQWKDDELGDEKFPVNGTVRNRRAADEPELQNALTYHMMALPGTSETLLYYGRESTSPSLMLPIGDPTSNTSLNLYVVVIDSFGSYAMVPLSIEVPGMNSTVTCLELYAALKVNVDVSDLTAVLQIVWLGLAMEADGTLDSSCAVPFLDLAKLYTIGPAPLELVELLYPDNFTTTQSTASTTPSWEETTTETATTETATTISPSLGASTGNDSGSDNVTVPFVPPTPPPTISTLPAEGEKGTGIYREIPPCEEEPCQLLMRAYFTEMLARMEPEVTQEIEDVSNALAALVQDPTKMTKRAYKKGMDLLWYMSETMKEDGDETPAEDALEIAEVLLRTGGDILSGMRHHLVPDIINCFDDCEQVFEDAKAWMKPQTLKFLEATDSIADTLVLRNLPTDTPVYIDSGNMETIFGKYRSQHLPEMLFNCTRGHIRLPCTNEFVPEAQDGILVLTYLNMDVNPFLWDNTSWQGEDEAVGSSVQLIRTRDEFANHTLNTFLDMSENASCGFELEHIFNNTPPGRLIPFFTIMTVSAVNDTATQLTFHTFNYTRLDEYVQLFFDPSLDGMWFKVFVKFNSTPNVNDSEYNITIPTTLPENMPGGQEEYLALFENVTAPYTYVLPKSFTNKTGPYTVGVLIKAQLDGQSVKVANYSFHVQFIGCSLWFEEENRWSNLECTVDVESTPVRVNFKSKVFPSSFGANLIIGPNTIDFGTVFEDFGNKLLRNLHVILTICAMLLLYFILLPVAHKYDKQDTIKWTAMPILAIPVDFAYHYTVDIYTGVWRGCGTESKVYFNLIGTKGESGTIELSDGQRKNFRRGDMNRFQLSTKAALGNITYIRVFHDNSGVGKMANWYCEKIIIRDTQNNKRFLFICDKWFAVEKGDYKIDRVLPIATRSQVMQFKDMFKTRTRKHFIDDHLWISVFEKHDEGDFTRKQRLSVAVALVFMTMISNCMWFGTEDSTEGVDGIQIGPVSLTLQSIVVSIQGILTVLPASLIVIIIFTRTKIRKKKDPNEDMKQDNGNQNNANNTKDIKMSDDQLYPWDPKLAEEERLRKEAEEEEKERTKKKKRPARFLPFWFIYIGWVMIFLMITASSVFTILYSVQWGPAKSGEWLASFFFSFFTSEGLIGPIKVVILALIMSYLFKKPVEDTDDLATDIEDTVFADDIAGEGPSAMDKAEIARLRKKRELEIMMADAIKQFIWHMLIVICLTLVTFGNRDPNSYRANEEMNNLFLRGRLDGMTKQGDVWPFMKNDVLPNMYKQHGYNGVAVSKADLVLLHNPFYMRLGPPYLRQYRVKPNLCYAPHRLMKHITCNEDFSRGNEDREPYSAHWKPYSDNDVIPPIETPLQKAFTYSHELNAETSYWGLYKSYYGGGYSVNLGNDLQTAENMTAELEMKQWLDTLSRAVILEFNVYNPHTNLFSLVSCLMEFQAYGGVVINREVKTVKLYRYIGSWGVLALASEIILAIFCIILIVRLAMVMRKEGCGAFWANFWHKMEAIKVFCMLFGFALYIQRTLYIKSTIEQMMNNIGELVSFRPIVLVDEVFIYLIGFALFIQILQICWVFKFNKSLAIFGATLKYSGQQLPGFGVAMTIIFLAFAIWSYCTYQQELYNYRDFLHTVYSQFNSMLGKFNTNELARVAGPLGSVMFLVYEMLIIHIFVNMLIVIIMDVHTEVCEAMKNSDNSKEFDLVAERMKIEDKP